MRLSILGLPALVLVLLAGCAGPVAPAASGAPKPIPSATPSPVASAEEQRATTLIMGPTAIYSASTDGEILETVEFTEPVAAAIDLITKVLGTEPTTTAVRDAECNPSFDMVEWPDSVAIKDLSPYGPTGDPRSRLPYRVLFFSPDFDGITLTTTAGISVDDDVTAFFLDIDAGEVNPSGPVGGVMLVEQGGTYLRELPGTEPAYFPVGIYGISDGDTGILDFVTSPAIGTDLYC